MAVLSNRELVGRGFQHKFGDAPTCDRVFALTLDDPNTPTQQMLDAVNIKHGDNHPEYGYLRCIEGSVSENSPDPWHAQISYRYELPPIGGNQDWDPNPLARADVWNFSTGSSQVPALFYYDEDTGDQKPLINGAGDFFEGLTTDESEIRASISGNRACFPLSVAASVSNSINSEPYLGGAKHTWKCAGISAQMKTELVNGAELNYWAIGVELVYRASGWPLLLPHVGWTYLDSGQKQGVFVYGPYGEKIAASAPQALTDSGALKCAGGGCEPDLLKRRVNLESNFGTFFGSPRMTC